MVESRCAIDIVVLLPLRRAARALLTSVSDSASRAEVAALLLLVLRMIGVNREGLYLRRGLIYLGSLPKPWR